MINRITLKYGLISGFIAASGFTLFMILSKLYDSETEKMGFGELIGSTFLFLAMTLVFFGLRSIRSKNMGTLSFKQAFLNGLVIVLVSSFIYVIGWMVLYPILLPDFADQYLASQIEILESNNLDPDTLRKEVEELKAFNENYKRPHIMASYTFLEIFPLGLIATLISSLILRRKD